MKLSQGLNLGTGFLIFLISGIIFPVFGQNSLYVAPGGEDLNTAGTIDTPFASLEYAAGFAQPGDTIFLRGGDYFNDSFDDGDIWSGDSYASITLKGTQNQLITIKAYQGEVPKIHFDHSYGLHLINSSYVVIEGLEIHGIGLKIDYEEAIAAWGLYKKNGTVYDLAVELGIDPSDPGLIGQSIDKQPDPDIQKPGYYNGRGLVANKSHHVLLRNNKIFDAPSSGLRIQQCDYSTAIGNEVAYCTYWTSQGVGALTVAESTNIDQVNGVKITLAQNRVHHNENKLVSWNPGKTFIKFVIDEGSGIFLTRNADTYKYGKYRIVNNLSYQNGARGIVIHKTDNATVDHNTLYYNGANCTGEGAGIGVNTVYNVVIRNNIIFTRPEKFALGILAYPVEELKVSRNLLFNEYGPEALTRNIDEGWEEADPLFVDKNTGMLDPEKSSPAIDAAEQIDNPAIDFYGRERTDGFPDIGSIEFIDPSSASFPRPGSPLCVFPNPCRDELYIEKSNMDQYLMVFSQNGLLILKIQVDNEQNSLVKIDLSSFEAGIYYIASGNRIERLIKY